MRVLALDIETTGLDHAKDYVTELGWVVKETGDPKPFVLKSRFCQLPAGVELSEEIRQLTKIRPEHLSHGTPLAGNVKHLDADIKRFGVQYIVAHNGTNFDRPFLEAKLAGTGEGQALFDTPWLDTKEDVIYPPDCASTSLLYVAAYFGYVNPFPHAALFDAMTTLKVLEQFDVHQVVARSKIPWVVVKADVTFEQKDLAKARRYYWENIGTQTFKKSWVKRIKETDLDKEETEAPFLVTRLA